MITLTDAVRLEAPVREPIQPVAPLDRSGDPPLKAGPFERISKIEHRCLPGTRA